MCYLDKMAHHSRQQCIQANNPFQIVSEQDVQEMLQECRRLIDDTLRQNGKMAPIIQAMQPFKIEISKRFIEFLLYIINLFRNAIENKTITLKNSARQSIKRELNDATLVLHYVLKTLCGNQDDATSYNDSVAIIISSATKVSDILKELQKKQWLRWFRSAKNISALVPIFEKITKVVEGTQCIECVREFSELLGDVEELRASLDDIKKRVMGLEAVGLSTACILFIGGAVCLIVGGIMSATPAAPAGVPLMIAGGAGVGAALVSGCGTELCAYLARKRLGHAEEKGDRKGYKFVDEDATELSQPC